MAYLKSKLTMKKSSKVDCSLSIVNLLLKENCESAPKSETDKLTSV